MIAPHTESAAARGAKDYSARLRLTDAVHAPALAALVDWLEVKAGMRVADVGCGAGGVTGMLAELVGEGGAVIAVDVAAAHLEATRARLEGTPYANRVSYHAGSVDDLPLEPASLDLVWCSHVVHGQPDALHSLRQLHTALKPGGRLALREDPGLTRLLPHSEGEGAGLEGRINAFLAEDRAAWRRQLPDATPRTVGWIGLLREVGFTDVRVRSTLLELTQPLSTVQLEYLTNQLEGLRADPELRDALSETDRAWLERWTDPSSDLYALNRADLHTLECLTVFVGSA